MADSSFDVVSDYDKSEIINVIDQAQREIANRYDFKGTSAQLEWLTSDKTGVKITGDSTYHIDAIIDIIRKKLASRGQSQKLLDTSKEPQTTNLKTIQEVLFQKGLDQDKAKKITALIRQHFPKVKATIQGDEVRVSSSKKDDLQAVIVLLRQQDFDFPIHMTNYR